MKIGLLSSLLVVSFASGLPATSAHADVLLIERAQDAQAMALPSRGMTMSQVEARFGAPVTKRPPVGGGSEKHPPITRWNYADFTVYFEHSHVVDTVLTKATPGETGPKPIQ